MHHRAATATRRPSKVFQTRRAAGPDGSKPLCQLQSGRMDGTAALGRDDYFAALANTRPPAAGWRLARRCATSSTPRARLHRGADLLALTLLKSPARWAPTSWSAPPSALACPWAGGPHAAFMACRDEFKRSMPGRLVGVSVDATATRPTAWRCNARAAHPPRKGHLQHLHRAGAAAVMASMYAVYHGPAGLRASPSAWRSFTAIPAGAWRNWASPPLHGGGAFDTLTVCAPARATAAMQPAQARRGANLRRCFGRTCGVSWTRPPPARTWPALVALLRPGQAACPASTPGSGAAPLIPPPAPHQQPS